MNSLLVILAVVIGYFMMSDKSLKSQMEKLKPIHYIGFLIVAVFVCNMDQKEGLCTDDLTLTNYRDCDANEPESLLWNDNNSCFAGSVTQTRRACDERAGSPDFWTSIAAGGGGSEFSYAHCCTDGSPQDCHETGNTPEDCLSTCAVASAHVVTPATGSGTACAGDHTCLHGEGACVVTAVELDCVAPLDTAGYNPVTSTNLRPTGFSATVTCATGYTSTGGGPTVTPCVPGVASGSGAQGRSAYGLTGCKELDCVAPDDTSKYNDVTGTILTPTGFNGEVTCDSGYESTGDGPTVMPCVTGGTSYVLTGCDDDNDWLWGLALLGLGALVIGGGVFWHKNKKEVFEKS